MGSKGGRWEQVGDVKSGVPSLEKPHGATLDSQEPCWLQPDSPEKEYNAIGSRVPHPLTARLISVSTTEKL